MRTIRKLVKLGLVLTMLWNCYGCASLRTKTQKKEEKTEEETQKPVEVSSFSLIENQQIKRKDIEKAIIKHKEKIEKREDKEDKGSAFINSRVGDCYSEYGNLDSALTYYYKALKIYEKINDKDGLADVLFSLGYVYKKKGDMDRASNYYKEYYEIVAEQEKEEIQRILNSKNQEWLGYEYYSHGNTLLNLGRFEEALEVYKKALEWYKIQYPKEVEDLQERINKIENFIGK